MQQILRTLEKACTYLDFDDVGYSGRSKKKDFGDEFMLGSDSKQFYEDTTLQEDEKKLVEVIEEKRKQMDILCQNGFDMQQADAFWDWKIGV